MRGVVAVCVCIALLCGTAQARVMFGKDVEKAPDRYYSTNAEGLDSAALVPPPPDYGSVQFLHDQAMYLHGLSLRSTTRGAQAAADCDTHHLSATFSEAFGGDITPEDMPELYALTRRAGKELSNMSTRTAKHAYKRLRPFVLYQAGTCYPPDEPHLTTTPSYPSGHSSLGWGMALILSEINPGRKEHILRRGYEYGQSRVICGYHWQSDVDAGRLTGAAGVANLHANAAFLKQLHKAKEEFARLAAQGKVKTE